MSEITMEILKVIVMLAVMLAMRYLIPLLKELIGAAKMEEIRKWVKDTVLMAQQVHEAKTGAERKAIVVDMLHNMLIKKNIDISEEQLNTLIEAAVKAMKMQDKNGSNIKIFGT